MIYFLKTLYSFVLPPGLLIVLFALLAVRFAWRRQRGAAASVLVVTALLYASTIPAVGEAAMRSLESRYTPPAAPEGDVYLMLTGGAVADVPDPDGAGQLNGGTLSRVVAVAELYRRKPMTVLISGGEVFADTDNEGRLAKRKLMALGVPEKDIVLEDQSRTTEENAAFSARLLASSGLHRPVLVTSAYHMARSVKHFKAQQVEVLPYPTDYRVSPSPSWRVSKFVPSSGALELLSMTCKEYLGLLQ